MAADQVDAADGRVALAQAALAEKEREALEAIRGDICEWLGSLLAVDISGGSFMRALDTGVALCQLAALLQRRGAAEGDAAKEPVPITVNLKAERASFFARDNAASFLSWCRRLGVREEWLFESSGLVEHRDERRVVLCLLDLGRHAARLGLCAPQLVCMEKEIEALERLSAVGQETVGRETVVQEPAGQEAASQDGGSQVAVAAAVEEVPPVRQGGGDRECDADEQGPPPRKKQRREGGRAEAGMRPGAGVGAEAHVEEKVMQQLRRCVCAEGQRVQKCGGGKFIIERHNRKTTLHARLLSDRVMVRVGGGWDTLDHFLLKHDPCRLRSISGGGGVTLSLLGKHRREH